MSQYGHNNTNTNANANSRNYTGNGYQSRRGNPYTSNNSQYAYPQQFSSEYNAGARYVYPTGQPQPYYQGYYSQNYYQTPGVTEFDQSEERSRHQIALTTLSGEKVDLNTFKSKSKTPTTHNISIAKPEESTTSASVTDSKVTPLVKDDKKAIDIKESFKAAILAKAKAQASKTVQPPKAEEKSEPKKDDEVTSQVENAEEAKKDTEESKQADSEGVKDQAQEEVKGNETEEKATQESQEELSAKEEIKQESNENVEKESDTNNTIEEEAKKENEDKSSENSLEVVEESKDDIKEEEQQPTQGDEQPQAEEPEVPTGPTVSDFLQKVSEAKDISDPFTFKYSEGIINPDERLKENCQTPIRYDPPFLLQFISKTKFYADQEFKKSISFLLENLSEKSRGSGHFKGGFGQGSISGIQGGQFSKSSSNLRKFNNFDSRSNSRQSSKRKGGSGRGDRKSNRNRDRDSEKDKDEPSEPVKPLEKSATRWIPKSKATKTTEVKYAPDGTTILLSEDEVVRKIKSLLNKLTLEYFEPITDDIIEIANQSQWEDDAATLKVVLSCIFDKATDEPHWSGMYAQLCAKLCKKIKDEVKTTEPPVFGGKLARTLLLTKCQQEYEKGWAENLPTNEDGTALEPEMMTDDYYRIAAAKRRGLGLVRLISHLFVLGILSAKVVYACLFKLLEDIDTPGDDVVESLIQLLKTAGPTIDATPGTNMNSIFEKIKYMSEKAKIPSRLQFSLLDLVDLRRNNWKGGEAEKGPKTITEIHEEEKRKQQDEQRAKSERSKQRGGESRSNSSRNAGWGNRVSDSDIRSVGKISSPKSPSDLGPENNFTKIRSKSNRQYSNNNNSNVNTSSPLSTREPRAPSNSFHLLNEDNGEDEEEEEEEEQTQEEANDEIIDAEAETEVEVQAQTEEETTEAA